MAVNDQGRLLLEQELSYWKAYTSVHDVLASELSYSLIYDNIHPDKVDQALSTVGLDTLPNRFFLIQIDDYQNHANKLRLTQEFFQKTSLINFLRDCMRLIGLRGFVANLIGQENVTCFLCCDSQEKDGINDYLLSVAEEFKKCVRSRSPYTISICISQRCDRLVQYSKMYPRMSLALSRTYFLGKEFSILLEEVSDCSPLPPAEVDLNDYYPELLVSLTRHDREHFERILQGMISALLNAQTRPQRARLEMIRLTQRLEEYCIQCGVPEHRMQAYNEAVISKILACSFIADTRTCLRDYYEKVAHALEECAMDDSYSFQVPVREYIAAHYQENIRLGDLAAAMGFSEGHFSRSFRKSFGMTFVQYLTNYRIEQSKRLLADTRLPIEQIAFRVGLNSYSYFCTCFKRACGISPGAYRTEAARTAAAQPPVSQR